MKGINKRSVDVTPCGLNRGEEESLIDCPWLRVDLKIGGRDVERCACTILYRIPILVMPVDTALVDLHAYLRNRSSHLEECRVAWSEHNGRYNGECDHISGRNSDLRRRGW